MSDIRSAEIITSRDMDLFLQTRSKHQRGYYSIDDVGISPAHPLGVNKLIWKGKTKVPWHSHQFYEICITKKGEAYQETANTKQRLTEGSVYILAPGEEHALYIDTYWETYDIYYLYELFDKEIADFVRIPGMLALFFYHFLFMEDSHIPCFRVSKNNHKALFQLLEAILISTGMELDHSRVLYEKNLFMNILILITASYRKIYPNISNITRNNQILQAVRIIENTLNLETKQIMDLICDKSRVGRECLFSLFKKELGYTLSEYIIRRKIMKSCNMLLTDKSFTEIAFSLGFYDSSHFIRYFKKYINATPSEYKKKVLDSFHSAPGNHVPHSYSST